MGAKKADIGSRSLSLGVAIGYTLLSSAIVYIIMQLLAPVSIGVQLSLAKQSLLLIPCLNLLPILLCMLLLLFALNSLVGAVAPVAFVMIVMAIVNRTKLLLRGDPLVHWDLALIGEVMGIARGFGLWPIALAILGTAIFLIASLWIGRRVKLRRQRPLVRVIGAATCAVVMVLCNWLLYANPSLDRWLPIYGTEYNAADVHNSHGNLYSFLHTWNKYRSQTPEGYDEALIQSFVGEKDNQLDEPIAETRPHIIMIMSEALSDLSDSDALDFTGYRDPLEQFKALGDEGIAGHLVVPGRGGGTADTEFDVLTGCAARYLHNAPYGYRLLNGPFDALPSLLRDIGYDTFAMHPGFPWFYNRQNVYRFLGFDALTFADAFPQEAYRDYYIGEAATFDMLIDLIHQRISADSADPIFGFSVTIQNHAPFAGRFLPEGELNYNTDLPMTAEEHAELSNYFAGIIDSDNEIARLAETLNALDEPAILVCFGDHLPALPTDLYDLLIPGADAEEDSFARATRLYQVPFIIWENTASKSLGLLDARIQQASMPDNMVISSNYLGGYLLELLGLDKQSAFITYANEMRAAYPVIMEELTYDNNGNAIAQDQLPASLRMYRYWMYMRTAGVSGK